MGGIGAAEATSVHDSRCTEPMTVTDHSRTLRSCNALPFRWRASGYPKMASGGYTRLDHGLGKSRDDSWDRVGVL
eukprot:7052611-Prymnesium_polylepis.1